MKEAGAYTLAQEENACVIYGMPNAEIQVEAVYEEVSLPKRAETTWMKCCA